MRTSDIILLATLSALISLALGAVRPPPRGPFTAAKHYRGGKHLIDRTLTGDRLSQCEQRTRDAKLDHFSWTTKATFKQRYFVCDRHYKPGKGAIFFYLGNEADVLLYLNNTGLMWELAPEHNAMLVFAEHRYYGESKPFPAKKLRKHMAYLTSEQAMADYADLLWELKEGLGEENVPVIGFGGSYGGMLATWFRMK